MGNIVSVSTPFFAQSVDERSKFNQALPLFPVLREGLAQVIDSQSLMRNSLWSAAVVTTLPSRAMTAISLGTVVGGAAGIPLGALIAREGVKKVCRAVQLGDQEGALHKSLWAATGVTYVGLSSVLTVDGAYMLLGKTSPSLINPLFAYGGVALYGAILAYGAYGYAKADQFEKRLCEAYKEGKGLDWLKNEFFLTESERQAVEALPESERGTAEQKALQRKWNRLELRIGSQTVSKLLQSLKSGEPLDEKAFVYAALKGAFKEKVKNFLFVFISILGVLSCVFVVKAFGMASPLLFAIGALLWFTLDSSRLHNAIGNGLWKFKEKELQELLEPKNLPAQKALSKKEGFIETDS